MSPREFTLAVIILLLNIVTTIVMKRIDQNPKPSAFSIRTKRLVSAMFQRYILLVLYVGTFILIVYRLFAFVLESEGALTTRSDAFFISAASTAGIVWGITTFQELRRVIESRRKDE